MEDWCSNWHLLILLTEAFWRTTVLWSHPVLLRAAPMSSLDYTVGRFPKMKGSRTWECSVSSQRHIYPLYSPVLAPVIPVNIRHLSLTHTGTRAVPHQFPPWVNHPTSHLCFQTHTHTFSDTHPTEAPSLSWRPNRLISLRIWELWLALLTALTHLKAFLWINAGVKRQAVNLSIVRYSLNCHFNQIRCRN